MFTLIPGNQIQAPKSSTSGILPTAEAGALCLRNHHPRHIYPVATLQETSKIRTMHMQEQIQKKYFEGGSRVNIL